LSELFQKVDVWVLNLDTGRFLNQIQVLHEHAADCKTHLLAEVLESGLLLGIHELGVLLPQISGLGDDLDLLDEDAEVVAGLFLVHHPQRLVLLILQTRAGNLGE